MINAMIESIIDTLSPRRFETYLKAAGYERNRALALYVWNAKIGAAFHFPLQAVEVALRNRINHALVAEFGSDWWKNENLTSRLDRERLRDIDQVRRRIEHKRLKLETDQIVASLSFGFWVGMLHRRYNPALWGRHWKATFPNVPISFERQDVYKLAGKTAQFRNRVSHHEPLLKSDIQRNFRDTMLLLSWLCPTTHGWVKLHADVQIIVRRKP